MSERAEVSFDAALMMALRADAQKELDELPTPAQLEERYPDTSRWDARLQAALHKHRPVLKRVLITVLTLVILTLGALAVSADFRRAVYTMIQKFMPVEMQLTYQVDGEPSEQLPNGYSDHYVPDGFERDYEQGYDNEISFLHPHYPASVAQITLSTAGRCISFCRMPNCFLVLADTRYCHFSGRMGKSAMLHLTYLAS